MKSKKIEMWDIRFPLFALNHILELFNAKDITVLLTILTDTIDAIEIDEQNNVFYAQSTSIRAGQHKLIEALTAKRLPYDLRLGFNTINVARLSIHGKYEIKTNIVNAESDDSFEYARPRITKVREAEWNRYYIGSLGASEKIQFSVSDLLGLSVEPETMLDFHSLIEARLPYSSWKRFCVKTDLDKDDAYIGLGMNCSRSLYRRQKDGFHEDESERLICLAQIYSKALPLFKSDVESVNAWLFSEFEDSGKDVIELVKTEFGRKLIHEFLDSANQ